jgi:hypothetical protein
LNIQKIKDYFLPVSVQNIIQSSAIEWLSSFHKNLMSSKQFLIEDNNKEMPIELSISVFDVEAQALKYVAFYCPKCGDLQEASIWGENTLIGHPTTGFAYKRKQFQIQLNPTGNDSEFSKFLRKPACIKRQNEYIKSFAATPLFYPFDSYNVVGVFELATCSDNDLIYKWNDKGTMEEKTARKKAIGRYINAKFKKFCEENIF